VTTADVSNAVSELTRDVCETRDLITGVNPSQVTEADRAALDALLDALAKLITTAKRLAHP
jgi:hypothetical protein